MSNLSVVAKFGGTSVADYDAMLNCYQIVRSNPQVKVVVLSASAGITNLLVELAEGCDKDKRKELLDKVRTIQFNIINRLQFPEVVAQQIESCLSHIASLSEAASLATSEALSAAIVAHGELMSTQIFAQICAELGCKAKWFDARDVITTNDHFSEAKVDIEATLAKRDLILEAVNGSELVITQGFIGREPTEHKTTVLGRGGSDYSAALFAEVIGAGEVHIWTDVAGIYTTDPRVCERAVRIDTISFREASEMAVFGAKVLHPATILPAVRANIPVFIGSSKKPQDGGTWITKDIQNPPAFRGIACKRNQVIITISSLKMLGTSGFLSQVFDIFSTHGVIIDCVTTSEVSVAVTVDVKNPKDIHGFITPELVADLERFGRVYVESGFSLVALIGNNMQNSTNIASTLNSLNDLPIRMIFQGASDNNFCLLVNSEIADTAIRNLHAELFEQ